MTMVQAIQAWCVLNVLIYVFARHVFNYGRAGLSFLEYISNTPEVVNNNPIVLEPLRDVQIPSFNNMLKGEHVPINLILGTLVASAIMLVAMPVLNSTVAIILLIPMWIMNANTFIIGYQLLIKRMLIKRLCNRFYDVVESYRLDKEQNEEMKAAFMQFANRINEVIEENKKAGKEDGSDD